MATPELTVLERRRIEANIAMLIYDEMAAVLGSDQAKQILSSAITKESVAQGRSYANDQVGEATLQSFYRLFLSWTTGGALEVEPVTETKDQVHFNVRRCKFAELYKEMGNAEIGRILSCGRDGTICSGFNPNIKLERTQTIMEGAPYCDFRLRWEEAE